VTVILVGVDASEGSGDAVAFTLELARSTGARAVATWTARTTVASRGACASRVPTPEAAPPDPLVISAR
jgi:hypothetical protein